jgi:regulator of sigma E protease
MDRVLMGILTFGFDYIIVFLIVLTVLVFFHELGHYLVARACGVRVEVFSIGFGPELFGWFDRGGTRWKVSALPLGGYVKMFGDADATSLPSANVAALTAAERAVSFPHKRLSQRIAVVAAGPIANFVLAIVLFAALFATVGQQYTTPEVSEVKAGTAADAAGIKVGDVIAAIDGRRIDRFEDVIQAVRLNPGLPMTITVKRGGRELSIPVTPRMTEMTDRFGNTYRVGLLGISGHAVTFVQRDPLSALKWAVIETGSVTSGILRSVWQMLIGLRSTEDVGGPVSIARMAGEMAQGGVPAVVWFMAMVSVNLGLINLFPIPVLDGGLLLFYAAEATRGKPLGQRAQEYGFRVGLALVFSLMIYATWNDLSRLRVLDWIKGWMT